MKEGGKVIRFKSMDPLERQRRSERVNQLIDALLRVEIGDYEESDFTFLRVNEQEFYGEKRGWALHLLNGITIPTEVEDEFKRMLNRESEFNLRCYSVSGGVTLDTAGNIIQRELILLLNCEGGIPEVLSFIPSGNEGIHWMNVDSNNARTTLSTEAQEWLLNSLEHANTEVTTLALMPTQASEEPIDAPLGRVIDFTAGKTRRNLL